MLFAEADLEIGFDTLGWNEDQDPEYFGSQRTFAAYDVSADMILKKKNQCDGRKCQIVAN